MIDLAAMDNLKNEFIDYLIKLLYRNRDVAVDIVTDKWIHENSQKYLDGKFSKEFQKRCKKTFFTNLDLPKDMRELEDQIFWDEYSSVLIRIMKDLSIENFVQFTSFVTRRSFTQR